MDGFLTVKEVCKILNCDHKTIRRHIRAGHLKVIDIGVGKQIRYRIRQEDLDNFIEERAGGEQREAR